MCSNVLKPVQNLFKCVQICSNVFKYVQTCSNLFKTCSNVIKWVQICSKLFQMSSNVFKWVNPNNWGKIYQPFQCKGSDMTSRAWSSFNLGWCRWQARFGGSFLSVAEEQQIHIFFFLQPPEQIHILPRKPPCHLHPPNSTQLPPSLSPLGAGFWLWAGCGVAEDSAGQRGRVERVTAWRGLNIWDGTDMLMYTTHLILFAENAPSLQLSLRAKANKTFTCDIILLTVC